MRSLSIGWQTPLGTPSQYERGARKEYELMKELRAAGWPVVLRMAGSHGLCDVIAIDPRIKEIRVYQVKYSTDGEHQKVLLVPSGTYSVRSLLRVYKKGGGFREWPD